MAKGILADNNFLSALSLFVGLGLINQTIPSLQSLPKIREHTWGWSLLMDKWWCMPRSNKPFRFRFMPQWSPLVNKIIHRSPQFLSIVAKLITLCNGPSNDIAKANTGQHFRKVKNIDSPIPPLNQNCLGKKPFDHLLTWGGSICCFWPWHSRVADIF